MLLRCLLQGAPVALLLKYKENSCSAALCAPAGPTRSCPALVNSTTVPLRSRSPASSSHCHVSQQNPSTARSCLQDSARCSSPDRAVLSNTAVCTSDSTRNQPACSSGASDAAQPTHRTDDFGSSTSNGNVERVSNEADLLEALFDRWHAWPPSANLPKPPPPTIKPHELQNNAQAPGPKPLGQRKTKETGCDGCAAACATVCEAVCQATAMIAVVLQHLPDMRSCEGVGAGQAVADPAAGAP